MTVTVYPFLEEDSQQWDEFSEQADQSTFLHTRRFLNYHGGRFVDRSLLIKEDGKLLGLFPAAEHPQQCKQVTSHPGITYGGVLHSGALRGEKIKDAIVAISRYFNTLGYESLIYKAVPTFYHSRPAQDDLYAMFRLGALRIRCDLSSAIDLSIKVPVSSRRRRGLKKSRNAGVSIVSGVEYLPALWEVLSENLIRKHGVTPVHSLNEITLLMKRFPNNIHCLCGVLSNQVVAGIIIFSTTVADHAQYIASSEKGYEVSALDMVFDHCIMQARESKKHWFDFGVSTEDNGAKLNEGLYRFKTEFGAGGFVHEFYEIELRNF
ncbi:GNAT family N-acetyltransferase [Spartinivicinus ruber]|uniref:GNAT family N-acetyltransferase n=1 Tax=Spartinivicinus ruber TaxID=2683272 RepID=UPI0013D4581B|nr:GNAT family N-acetyltransferase [Spartinivicinus ruber]